MEDFGDQQELMDIASRDIRQIQERLNSSTLPDNLRDIVELRLANAERDYHIARTMLLGDPREYR